VRKHEHVGRRSSARTVISSAFGVGGMLQGLVLEGGDAPSLRSVLEKNLVEMAFSRQHTHATSE